MKKKICISLLFVALIGGTTYAYKNSSEIPKSVPMKTLHIACCDWPEGTCLPEIIITPNPVSVTLPELGSIDPTRP